MTDDYNIYIGSSTGAFKGVCLQKDKCRITNIQNVKFTTNKVSVVALNWGNKEESEIIVAYSGQKIKIYDTDFRNFNTHADVSFGKGEIVGVSRYDECVLTAVQSGDVKLWRYKSTPDQWTNFNVGKDLDCMAHNKQTDKMATGGKENDLKLWDLVTGKNVFAAKNVKPDEFDLRKPVWVTDVDFLPTGDKVVLCSKQGYVRVYDPNLGSQRRPVLNVEVPDCAFTTLSTTNQNHYVIVGTTTGDMFAMDLRGKGKPCYKYKGFAGCVKDIAYASNENLVLSASLDRHFRVHDFHSKKMLRKEYMQSKLTSILVRSDFTLENINKKRDEEDEGVMCDNDGREEDEEKVVRKDEEADDGSDLEIIEDEETRNGRDEEMNESVEEEEEEEEAGESENEYYEEEEEDNGQSEGEDEDRQSGGREEEDRQSEGEDEDEMFPLEKKKRRSEKTDNGVKKRTRVE